MFISKIYIHNFRNFEEQKVHFNPGLNVVIGHNNSGKTNLIRALQLIFDRNRNQKPNIEDFCKDIKDYSKPPSIEISAYIEEHDDEKDDKNVVYNWLIQDSPKYIARLTYVFKLPTKHHEEYSKAVEACKVDGDYDQELCLQLIRKKFLSKYVSRIYGGDPSKQEKANQEDLDRFDFQFLTAIRDAERQMFYGNNTLLQDVLNYFLDYDITEGQGFDDLSKEELQELEEREKAFKEKSSELLEILIKRIDKNKILEYSVNTGAAKGGSPNFDADAIEQDLLFALRLIVEKSGLKIPINNNGLGYNNLLFIALILAKMQMESSAAMGDNAKVFPMLAIEEPEAHLHPSMQSKFLKFLENNLKTNAQARQIFVTSHSTHITSAVKLDSVICLYTDVSSDNRIGYPAKVFGDSSDDISSKIYIERFLDATKSNLLFADRVILVEGTAEQLLLPCFAQYLGLEDKLLDEHICIVSVDSRTFKHFLKLFSFDVEDNSHAINKRVVCITDADPIVKQNKRWCSAFPFSLSLNGEHKPLSPHVTTLINDFDNNFDNISVFHPTEGKGKTLEYEIAKENPTSELLITDSFPSQNSAHTKENFRELQSKFEAPIDELIEDYKDKLGLESICENDILSDIIKSDWDEKDKKEALIAAIYYTIVKNAKGEHSFYLGKKLRENFQKEEGKIDFKVPDYIENALIKVVE